MKQRPAIILATLAACFLLWPPTLQAQEKNEEVTIIAPYRPTIGTAQKINRNPRISIMETTSFPEVEYQVRSERINTTVTAENPQPSRVPGEPQKDLYRSHLRAGFGNYLTPYFELWVNSLQSDEFKAGAHLGYISSFGQIKDYAKSTYSNTLLEAHATKFFRGASLGAKASYKRNMVHRYGFMPGDFPMLDIPDDDLRQVYQTIGFEAGVESSNAADDAFNYHVRLDGYHLADRFESNETRISVIPGFSKGLDLFGNRRMQLLGLDVRYDHYINNDSLDSYGGGILSMQPYFDMDLHPYRIYIGLKADYRIDTASGLHLYPVVKAEASLLDEMIVVYAGLEGGLQKTTYEGLSSENPFINSVLPLEYTNRKIAVEGGVRGRAGEIADFNLRVSHATIDNLPLFVTDTVNITGNTFDVIYDHASVLGFHGELGFRSRSDFGLLLKASYLHYDMDSEAEAWQRPSLLLGLETHYTIGQKLTLSANITGRGSMYARTFSNGEVVAEQIDGWIDLGLGGEYRINRQFSAFLKLNNLLSQGYFRWYNYPVQKFNALAGIGFSF
jgi:hypothetical protein